MSVTDLQFAVMTALAKERRHGYALLEDIEGLLGGPRPVATAYACFETLMRRRWIEADGDEIVNGRTRRYYRLTSEGVAVLSQRADALAVAARTAQQRLNALPSELAMG